MSETRTLTIRDRIIRQIVVFCQSIEAVGTVNRWDSRGKQTHQESLHLADLSPEDGDALEDGDMIVYSLDDEWASEGDQGSTGYTTKLLPVVVGMITRQAEDNGENSDAIHCHRLGLIEAALMGTDAAQYVTEATGVRLARQSIRVSRTTQSPGETGSRAFISIVHFDVPYEHNRNSPYQGPGIEALTIELTP